MYSELGFGLGFALSGSRIGAGTGWCLAFAGVDWFGYWCWELDRTALLSHNGP